MPKCSVVHSIYINGVLWICFSLDMYQFKALNASVTAACFAIFERKYAVIRLTH